MKETRAQTPLLSPLTGTGRWTTDLISDRLLCDQSGTIIFFPNLKNSHTSYSTRDKNETICWTRQRRITMRKCIQAKVQGEYIYTKGEKLEERNRELKGTLAVCVARVIYMKKASFQRLR